MSEVWKTLSVIDCSEFTGKKGNLTYLSWVWAWGTLMAHYPDSSYTYVEPAYLPDGSVMVEVSVTVAGTTRTMWLPVLDNRNKAIQGPTSRDISDARMRCLVKCIAMHGLGHYIYAGEDMPVGEGYSAEQKEMFDELVSGEDALAFLEFSKAVGDDVATALHNSGEPGKKVSLKKQCGELSAKGHAILDEYAGQITDEALAGDVHAAHLMGEVATAGPFCKKALWGRLSVEVQNILKDMRN
jgi:hypothetical protein